jgi:hypothetical protein
MKWTRFWLIVACAAILFGGTFTCRSDEDSERFTSNPTTPVNPGK